jgi:hypothetical protein
MPARSEKGENHGAAVALHLMQYNFRREHQKPRSTPAINAGIADPFGSVAEAVSLADSG